MVKEGEILATILGSDDTLNQTLIKLLHHTTLKGLGKSKVGASSSLGHLHSPGKPWFGLPSHVNEATACVLF